MNRRKFLSFLFGASTTVVVVPRLVRPVRLFDSLAPPPVPVGSPILSTEFVVRETLKVLEQNLRLTKYINRDYGAAFDAPLIGDTLAVRRPRRFVAARRLTGQFS